MVKALPDKFPDLLPNILFSKLLLLHCHNVKGVLFLILVGNWILQAVYRCEKEFFFTKKFETFFFQPIKNRSSKPARKWHYSGRGWNPVVEFKIPQSNTDSKKQQAMVMEKPSQTVNENKKSNKWQYTDRGWNPVVDFKDSKDSKKLEQEKETEVQEVFIGTPRSSTKEFFIGSRENSSSNLKNDVVDPVDQASEVVKTGVEFFENLKNQTTKFLDSVALPQLNVKVNDLKKRFAGKKATADVLVPVSKKSSTEPAITLEVCKPCASNDVLSVNPLMAANNVEMMNVLGKYRGEKQLGGVREKISFWAKVGKKADKVAQKVGLKQKNNAGKKNVCYKKDDNSWFRSVKVGAIFAKGVNGRNVAIGDEFIGFAEEEK